MALCALFAVSDTERLAEARAYLSGREAVSAARSGDAETARKLWESIADESPVPSEARAEALVALGNIAYDEGDFEAAQSYYLRTSPGRTE